ncbi:MAG: glucoamylase family protein [Erythrobacter sp.]|uniref:GH36-type glycosyl hydrolase domain-containing protein n=1 Tax=Erythrobacter sp. TaxID=1042 RepID=UPI0026259C75|nr:glucoamylase family protein [Erythrobacter sp.]MDJ0977568.1 glucoamylase family protein [Erythrobacter sp.]
MAHDPDNPSTVENVGEELGAVHNITRKPAMPIGALQNPKAVERWLHAARKACSKPAPEVAKAAEWLLDNDYHVSRALQQIRKDLPREFYLKLPALVDGEPPGPRVFALAHALLRATHLQLSLSNAVGFIQAYQIHQSLTIAELWAFPTMLRLACIEILVASLTPMLSGEVEVSFPLSPCASEPHSLGATDRVARSIANLSELAGIPWEVFFERVSLVEAILAKDPAQAYSRMDFETRDRYRRAVEEIAEWGGAQETDVAKASLALARAKGAEEVAHHVGYWLIDDGRSQLEDQFSAKPGWKQQAKRTLLSHPGRFFSLAMVVSGIACAILPVAYLARTMAPWSEWTAALLLSQIPASILAITLVHWLITRVTEPRLLPKLDEKHGVPSAFPVTIAVPVIIADEREIEGLAKRIEMHWLATRSPNVQVALLADLADAPAEIMPGDERILDALEAALDRLNKRYRNGTRKPFSLLLRPRLFNDSEGCWMAWERKRGKLEQFNRMLIEGEREAFSLIVGDVLALDTTRFVMTVDADTILPSQSVARLAGTLAHPLNRPQWDRESGRITRGYSIIQPRVEISPESGRRTRFARLFTGETAIDIYSRAVSDIYQDLFGSGIFVGKGIYDLHAFHRSVDNRVLENTILSHDLLEGALGRAALATDIVLYEGFPDSYRQYAKRLHRWIRGDWQLLPWLMHRIPDAAGRLIQNPIRGIDRWKVLDNLRRSLVAPGLVLLALAGWLLLPGNPWFWTALVLLAPAGQLFIDLMSGLARGRRTGLSYGFWKRLGDQAGRWLLVIVYMLHEALLSLHAIGITLWRRVVSKRRMLEWVSAAHSAKEGDHTNRRLHHWRMMTPSVSLAFGIAATIALTRPAALLPALLLLLPWLLAPEVTQFIERPRRSGEPDRSLLDIAFLRQLARKTWLYFETFAGPSDNWLPPDNFQGEPHEEIAHRTSPTNIGMMLLSTASAWDMGFVGRAELAARARNVFDSLERMERYRGHFLNWYETHHLRPLEPRYVSTVDSGNLAASLLVFAQTLRDSAQEKTLEPQRWTGLLDIIALIEDQARKWASSNHLLGVLAEFRDATQAAQNSGSTQLANLRNLVNHDLSTLEREAGRVMRKTVETRPGEVGDLNIWVERLHHHLHDMLRDTSSELAIHGDLIGLADQAEQFAWQMDFAWLYDHERRLFFIGHNVSTAKTDTHHYDLLASEARIASFFAIAKNDAPIEHWFHLGRPVTRASDGLALVSWNGSMFEYLMPRLVMPGGPETLLGESDRVAVEIQRRHGKQNRAPWGVSESAYAARDPEHRFRYRAFGVPGLGLRRGLAQDLVVAPYASALALAVDPLSAQRNLKRLVKMGAAGRYGLWEAIDFTRDRNHPKSAFAPVNAFMAHHQGMIVCAIGNLLTGDALIERFLRDPRLGLATLLLWEQIPHELPAEIERIEVDEGGKAELGMRRIRHEWVPTASRHPQALLMGNGRMASSISAAGCGGLNWQGQALTRFAPDPTLDAQGAWLYIRDELSEQVWSATLQPTGVEAHDERVLFRTHCAEFQRRENGIFARLEVTIGANDDIELRRLTIANESEHRRVLRITTYAEIVLAPPLEDERHPAFSKLFIRSERIDEPSALIFTRRPKKPEDTPPVLLQTLIGADGPVQNSLFDTDRREFIGRNRTLRSPQGATLPLQGNQGWTLDPVAALQTKLELNPGQSTELCLVTIAAASRSAALEILNRHATLSASRWLFDDAEAETSRALSRARIEPADLPLVHALGSVLTYPSEAMRPSPKKIRDNRLGQASLWGMAISGDRPILLLKGDFEDDPSLEFFVGAHQIWRRAGLEVDVVILKTLGSAYLEPVRDELAQLLRAIGAVEMLGRHGGFHLVFSDQVGMEQVRLLEAMAWAIIDASQGPLSEQLRTPATPLEAPPILTSLDYEPEHERPPERPDDLVFDNGYGGFTRNGREYVIHLAPGMSTPAPWVNVLANEDFGTLVTESGGGFSWSINSGEYRLTPWTNDPVSDRQGEVLYLRDEETSDVWSVTPNPAGRDATCQIRHGTGYTEWLRACRGLEQCMQVSVDASDPVKLVRLTLRNLGARDRRITATYYAEWLLGALPSVSRRHVSCRFDAETQAILATNPWNGEFAGRTAFLTSDCEAHGYTTDRREFVGRNGDPARPAGLTRWGLSGVEIAGGDSCAALQVHADLARGEQIEIVFALGEAENPEAALKLAGKWREKGKARKSGDEVAAIWDDFLGCVEVTTPDPAFDIVVNRWLLYQSLSSRILARTGFYQASGAIGFRDQLQDVLAFLVADPARARAHILECAAHQFEEGDVLHWWHPPGGRGVRTRCSDDLLWLPYATAHYVYSTGDVSILEEEVRFLSGPPLTDGEHDRYAQFELAANPRPLIEHCERALERVSLGSHRLPLIGAGDWNDGMDRVGDKGRGESVWLAWFASVCAASMAHCERLVGREAHARHWARKAAEWRRSAEESGWDGEWYRRAYDDEGSPLGSQENDECMIDSISQSWSVFAGRASSRSRSALQAALRELVDDDAGIARLLWPPFDKAMHNPGYIKAYPPGIRENGGQYSHAAAWLGLALARTGQGSHAYRIFNMLNPINHALTRHDADAFRTEPYAVVADIGSVGNRRGRGGWSWYTGAAAWTWRLAVEGILGLTLRDGKLHIAPSLPDGWDGYRARLTHQGGTIELEVTQIGKVAGRTSAQLTVDGRPYRRRDVSFPKSGQVLKVKAVIEDPLSDDRADAAVSI